MSFIFHICSLKKQHCQEIAPLKVRACIIHELCMALAVKLIFPFSKLNTQVTFYWSLVINPVSTRVYKSHLISDVFAVRNGYMPLLINQNKTLRSLLIREA